MVPGRIRSCVEPICGTMGKHGTCASYLKVEARVRAITKKAAILEDQFGFIHLAMIG